MPDPSARIHFPDLDGLRFVAAAMVFFPHVEVFKGWLGVQGAAPITYPHDLSGLGVTLFFVLSGFLITYLLLHEQAQSGTVSVRWFYLRRILRIWPLYYLVVVLGLLVLPAIPALEVPRLTAALEHEFATKLLLYLVLLPHLVSNAYSPVPFVSQAWSIGIEEQFYLVWPLILRALQRRLVPVLVAIVAGCLALEVALRHVPALYRVDAYFPHFTDLLWGVTNFSNMALGGLGACAAFRGGPALRFVHRRWSQVVVYALAATCAALEVDPRYGKMALYSALFAVMTVNLATNPHSLVRLRRPALRWLGRISYGIYMLHPLATIVVIKACQALGLHGNLVIYAASATLTVALAAASWAGFERRFLRLKPRYSVTISGEQG